MYFNGFLGFYFPTFQTQLSASKLKLRIKYLQHFMFLARSVQITFHTGTGTEPVKPAK